MPKSCTPVVLNVWVCTKSFVRWVRHWYDFERVNRVTSDRSCFFRSRCTNLHRAKREKDLKRAQSGAAQGCNMWGQTAVKSIISNAEVKVMMLCLRRRDESRVKWSQRLHVSVFKCVWVWVLNVIVRNWGHNWRRTWLLYIFKYHRIMKSHASNKALHLSL